MSRYESTSGSKTVTIGELYLHIKACDLSAIVLDTVVASEFEVSIEYTYSPGEPPSLADDGVQEEIEIKAIKPTANVQFAGDASDLEIKRGTDLLGMFTGVQVMALEDQVLAMIQKGGNDD